MQELQEMWVQSLSQGRPLEKKWQPAPVFLSEKSHAEEPGELQSIGSQKGGHLTFLKLCNLPPSGKGQAPVFDVFEAFLNTDNIQVFANAATSYIMCLMKFVKGLGKWSPPFPPPDS